MTSDQPFDRRRSDVKLDELIAKVDDVLEWQQAHLLNYHGNLAAHEAGQLVEEHRAMFPQVQSNSEMLHRIISILDGEDIYSDLDGHVVDRRPGMRADLADLKRQSANGGLNARMQFTPFQKAVITGTLALLGSVFALLLEVVRAM